MCVPVKNRFPSAPEGDGGGGDDDDDDDAEESPQKLLVPPPVIHNGFSQPLAFCCSECGNSCVCVAQTSGHVYSILVHPHYPGSFCSLSIYIF
jgi:hypothetical protein